MITIKCLCSSCVSFCFLYPVFIPSSWCWIYSEVFAIHFWLLKHLTIVYNILLTYSHVCLSVFVCLLSLKIEKYTNKFKNVASILNTNFKVSIRTGMNSSQFPIRIIALVRPGKGSLLPGAGSCLGSNRKRDSLPKFSLWRKFPGPTLLEAGWSKKRAASRLVLKKKQEKKQLNMSR